MSFTGWVMYTGTVILDNPHDRSCTVGLWSMNLLFVSHLLLAMAHKI